MGCLQAIHLRPYRDPQGVTHRELDAALSLFPESARTGWTATDDVVAYAAIRRCLATGAPFLGTCAGFQYTCVDLVRSRAGLHSASHAESDPDGDALVI
jgi:CTP synthase (UTP-ammonia lyase)